LRIQVTIYDIKEAACLRIRLTKLPEMPRMLIMVKNRGEKPVENRGKPGRNRAPAEKTGHPAKPVFIETG
jgi:hypothetical protein